MLHNYTYLAFIIDFIVLLISGACAKWQAAQMATTSIFAEFAGTRILITSQENALGERSFIMAPKDSMRTSLNNMASSLRRREGLALACTLL